MRWRLPWQNRQARRADDALRATEQMRDRAVEQRQRVEMLAPRVEAAVRSLRAIQAENHIGPMIKNVVRNSH